jgi:putative cell wall-binding protein
MKLFLQKLIRAVLLPLLVLFSVPAGFFFSVQTAFASTYTVTTNGNDPGNGDCTDGNVTIVEAVGCANAHPGADIITVPANGSMGGSITIGGSIAVDAGEDLTINGAGSTSTTISLGGINVAGAAFSLSGVGLTITGTPQSAISNTGAYTGNFSLNDVIINGSSASIGVFISDSDGYDITGNISVTNSDISAGRAAVAIGLPGGGSPTTKVHVTGTVDISDNTFTIAPPDGNGFNSAVAFFSADAAGAVSVNNNTFVQEGTAEASGFVAMDMNDFGVVFGSTVDISGNAMATGGTDLLGAGVADFIRSVGLTTISGNTISGGIGQDANFAGGVLMADGGCIFETTCVGQEDLLISNNDIDVTYEAAPSFPIILGTAEATAISGNSVDMNGEDGGGIACTSTTGSADCTLSGNTVSHVGGAYGILLTPANIGQTASGDIYNNVVWGGASDTGMGIAAVAMGAGGPQPTGTTINVNIYNNSVDGNGHTAGILAGDMTGDTTLNAVVFNNAVANYSTTNAAGIVQIGTSEAVSFLHDHNMSGPTSTHAFSSTVDGSSYDDLVLGTGDVVDDPEFIDASTGNLSIDVTSPAVDTGTSVSNAVSAPTTDNNGDPRPARDGYDIGAFEYQNQSPTVDAGVDQNKYKGASLTDSVTLHCGATDPEGDTPITYAWTRTSGPSSVSFTGGSTADASFTPGAVGTYVIRCTATDSLSAPGFDEMNVVVTANTAPSANAGVDQAVHTGDSVTLHCASTDTEEDTITYAWTNVSGPTTPSLSTPSTADSGFTAAAVGTYVVRCTTGDSYNTSATNDTVSIVVTDPNTAPNANAGADQYTSIDETNTLDCSGSTDTEDNIDTYAWTQTAGTSVSLSGASTDTATFTPTSFGDRTFQCAVTDVGDLSDTDSVVIHATAKRIAGASDRYDTAVKISQTQFTTAHAVNRLVIASGENYPDALAAGPLASLIGGPILLVQKNWLPSQTNTEITRLLPTSDGNGSTTDIYVIGGTAAISDYVYSTIRSAHPGFELKRIAGATDRVDTAIEIAKEMATIRGNAATTIALASGYNYNDAAAMSAPASDSTINSRRIPIFLTNTSNLDSRVSTYLNSIKGSVTKAWIVGTTGAVSNSAQTSMNSIFGSSKVTRLNGADAYGTSAAIATQFYGSPTQLSIVTGLNFPDVLSAGPYAGSKHMAVLYVTNSSVSSSVTAYADAKASTLTSMYVFGGTTVVPNSIKQTVQAHL